MKNFAKKHAALVIETVAVLLTAKLVEKAFKKN